MKARRFVVLLSLAACFVIALKLAAAGQYGWKQSNVSGFGEIENFAVLSLTPFKGQLYAGTANDSGNGAQLWQWESSDGWSQIIADGFANPDNISIVSLDKYNNRLYAGTANIVGGGQVWRSDDGVSWIKISLTGFDPTNEAVVHFARFENKLYATTRNHTRGTEIWQSSTGDSGDWTQVVGNGFDGDVNNNRIVTFERHNGFLFAGTDNTVTGAEVWYMDGAGVWSQINADGFGDPFNWSVTLRSFRGYLFAGTYNYFSDNPGHELWRCQTCNGTDWQMIPIAEGFGNSENRAIRAFEVLNGALFAVTYNRTDGVQVWRSADGENWSQVNTSGFGNSSNLFVLWDNGTTVFKGIMVVGTWNRTDGGEIWHYPAIASFASSNEG